MTDRELMQMVLDALNNFDKGNHGMRWQVPLIKALRARLSQSEQEPFEYWNAVEGWVKIDEVRQHFDTTNCGTIYKHEGEGRIPLYAELPQREWVGLTDDEIDKWNIVGHESLREFVRVIEAKLKEKNNG